MTDRPEFPSRQANSVENAPTSSAAPTIKARDDLEGCGCLDCRNVGTVSVNRTVLDMLVWSVRLFRSHRSIVVFAGVVILGKRLLETGLVTALPTPVVGTMEAVTGFVFVVLIRAYVGTIAASELTDTPVTVCGGLRRSVARTPALVGVVALVVLAAMLIPFVLSLPVVLLAGGLAAMSLETVGFPVIAAVGGIVFAVPFLLLVFKLWFAPEACVVGQYGPLESLRVSWRITGNYHSRFVLIVLIAVGSAISLSLPASLPELTTGLSPAPPVLDAISSSVGDFVSVLWASAYAHIYVQSVVS